MPFAKTRRIKVCLDPALHDRLVAEIAARRGASVSGTVASVLAEHFALVDEMASSIQPGTPPGEVKQGRIIHTLLAQTEERLGATIDRQAQRIGGVRGELAELRVMVDRLALALLVHLPEVPEQLRETAMASASTRHGKWRRAVEKLLDDGGLAPLRLKGRA